MFKSASSTIPEIPAADQICAEATGADARTIAAAMNDTTMWRMVFFLSRPICPLGSNCKPRRSVGPLGMQTEAHGDTDSLVDTTDRRL
jgi:hypothetical protein